jgi:hypothetical protein
MNAFPTQQRRAPVNVPSAAFAVGVGFLVGGIVTEVNHVLSFAAVVTAASTGVLRYRAVLLCRPQARVELETARGFYVGLIASLVLLVLDHLLG